MNQHQQLEIPYVAGLVDGEGCINFHFKKGKREHSILVIRIDIGMTHLGILSLISTQFGGSLNSYTHKNPKARVTYRWSISGKNALNLIRQLYPFLVVKKDQANLAKLYGKFLDINKGVIKDESVNSFFKEKMYELNKRGI